MPNQKSNNNNNEDHHHLNHSLAHSTSLLTSESYLSGMSSDSELLGSTRHSRRPYSSQSRVYHAHMAPHRSTSGASSRLSQYSELAAGYASESSQHQHPDQHLLHQASMSSSGSVSSSSYANVTTASEPARLPSSALQQQRQLPLTGQRQLPARPFKQSMSIDPQQQPLFAGGAQQQQQQQQLYLDHSSEPISYQQQQRLSYSPMNSGQQRLSPQVAPVGSQMGTNQRQRLFDVEMLANQAAGLSLHGDSSSIAPPVGLPPNSARHVASAMSLDQLGYQTQLIDQQQQQQQHYQRHQLPQHQYGSAHSQPAEWLPPLSIQHHQLANRPNQFKQAVSIDHYSPHQHQQQQQHLPGSVNYPPSQRHMPEHYRGQLGYAASSPIGGYDSPGHQLAGYQLAGSDHHGDIATTYQQPAHHQGSGANSQQQQQAAKPLANLQDLMQTGDVPGKGKQQQQQQQQQQARPSSNPSQLSARGKQASSQQQAKLQHQLSSSSSNSQSGSLRSCNIDINKPLGSSSSNTDNQQRTTQTACHFQQSPQHKASQQETAYRQGLLRKGYTSMVSTFGGSSVALNEVGGDSSAAYSGVSLPASSHHHLGSSSSSSRSVPKRALRATSPSSAELASGPALVSGGGANVNAASIGHLHHSSSSKHSAGSGSGGTRSESSTGLPNGASSSSLAKKSNSATQLSMAGTKKRLGFRKKQVTSFSVHRSEEVAPLEARHLVKQGSSVSEGDSSMSGDSSSRSWSNSNFKQPTSDELASMSFIDGLGKGQMISRQGLASPYLGDIQLSLCDRRGNLEIEVIRARNLQAKTSKILPLTYVKLYLVKNRKCLAKAKTTLSNKRTLDPLFQQLLTFHEDYHGCILQSIIWGNFGKMDKKNFMGISQISIDDLELGDTVISWYKLFLPSSLQTLPSKSLRHTLLSNSVESFTNNS